ncbi:MAG: acyltransferase [Labilithrix sp.]|nr:acyltransferase [Labilithrix sp.]
MGAFALEDNLRSLWNRRAESKKPVDGLRALSVLWVIAYHTLAFIGRPLRNSDFGPLLRIVNRGHLGVDVFFVISGFLIGSLLLREHEETGTIALRSFYVRRAMRILPAYFVTLAVYVVLIGRNTDMIWANLLFVNNFVTEGRQCMGWAWSLAVEEQFYIVFPFALLAAYKIARPLGFVVFAVGVGVVIRLAIVHHYGIHVPGPEHHHLFSNMLYNKPYGRFPQLLSGVLVGYLVHFTGAAERLRRAPAATTCGAVVAVAVVAALSAVEQPIFKYRWPTAVNFLYYALAQVIFSAGVAYVLFVSVTGLAGGRLLARVLSWRGFYPVSQLSYSAYLIHMIIIFVGLDLGVFPSVASERGMLEPLVKIPLITLVAAIPMYMLVEKPLMNLRANPRTRPGAAVKS